MDKETVMNRLFAVRGFLKANNVKGFVIRDTANIAWLTGIEGVFDSERAHTLLVTPDKAVLLTDSRYVAAARAAAQKMGKTVSVTAPAGLTIPRFIDKELGGVRIQGASVMSDAERAAAEAEAAKPFAIEDDISLAEYRAIVAYAGEQAPAPLETHNVIKVMRAVKTPEEEIRLRKAQRITDDAFTHMTEFIEPGMTEQDIRMELDDFMVWSGAEGTAFATIVAVGANSAKPHSIPGNTKLEAGQMVLLDFGAKYQGYCSDMTRCIFLGEPIPTVKQMYQTVVDANEAVEALLKPGVTGSDVQMVAEEVLSNGGFAGKMGHGLGHGVGMEIHEEPCLNSRNTAPLVQGNVVTVEPGIYLPDGKKTSVNIPMGGNNEVQLIPPLGIRVEDCGIITEDGFSVFTKTPHDMVII